MPNTEFFCNHCNAWQEINWQYDPDSEKGEPHFIKVCTVCLKEQK